MNSSVLFYILNLFVSCYADIGNEEYTLRNEISELRAYVNGLKEVTEEEFERRMHLEETLLKQKNEINELVSQIQSIVKRREENMNIKYIEKEIMTIKKNIQTEVEAIDEALNNSEKFLLTVPKAYHC